MKHRIQTIIRWSLLVDAIVLASLALLTAVKWPVWMPWMGPLWPTGMVVPEIGLWLAPLAIAFGAGATVLRRGHRVLTGCTLILCFAALLLLLKPAVQAWRLGRTLPAQLATAFGPADPQRPPFSLRDVAGAPQPEKIQTMEYAKSLKLDFYRAVGRDPAPCIVVVHGGSWVSGNRIDGGTSRWLNDWLATRGYAVASIDYRLSPHFLARTKRRPPRRDCLLTHPGV